MVNVTPATPPVFPILYTWGGEVYQISSLSGLGCADTVYSTTASTVNGTTTYTPYVVLPANQGMQVIEAYEAQFSVPNMACSSYIQQAELLSGVSQPQQRLHRRLEVSISAQQADGLVSPLPS
ncbi:MAG: hypothetical protein QXH07_01190 [Thermoplasmata archaeon]